MVTELGHAGSRIHKISSTFSKVIGDCGGGGEGRVGEGHSNFAYYSVKLCVMINFSLHHNVLCLSFVVVLYSTYICTPDIAYMQLLKWVSLMKEVVMSDKNLSLKVNRPLYFIEGP